MIELAQLYRVGADDASLRWNLRWIAPKRAARPIRGVVADAATGRGIPGALVFGDASSARTDERGEFALEDRGSRFVSIEAEGYALAELANPPDPSKPIRADLVRERPILGVVLDRDGRGVEGAVIRSIVNHAIFEPGTRAEHDHYGFPLTVRSDAKGQG